MAEFAHLHLHTEFSLLDGVGKTEQYVRDAKAAGITSMAITDHGVMYGALEWHKSLSSAGLHPIIGMEAYFAEGPAGPPSPDASDQEKRKARKAYHLLLLAQNNRGYRNLIKLASKASLEGYYYRPRIDMDMLRSHSDGLIATSACIGGPIANNLLYDRPQLAEDYAVNLTEIFGRERFFVEIQDHGQKEQHQVNGDLLRIAKSFDIPIVATNDVHYCARSDAKAQEILMCVQTNATLNDPKRLKPETDELYLKTPQEMTDLFSHVPGAVKNTLVIAEMCDLDLSGSGLQLPDFDVPEGMTNPDYLETLCRDGARRLYGELSGEVEERLSYELRVINGMELTNYFLVVWDFVRFAKENGILVGPGRGSAAGSIVAYVLGITALDPLEHGLIFERFLNPSRISMPDIDIDFADDRRQEVIDYVVQKYGDDRVAQITTFGTMAAKASLRDVGRAMAIPLSRVDQVAKLIPTGPNINIADSIETIPELQQLYRDDQELHELIDNARRVEGISRHASTHAAGVVISREPLMETIPLQRAGGKSEGDVTTQYPMGQLEELGLLKMDFLGLTTLSVIGKAVDMVRRKRPDLTVDTIPLDDPIAYEMLRRGDTTGVFQLEGGMTTGMTIDVAPERFADIVALMALIRPGPMENAPEYIAVKRGRKTVEYAHPLLEDVLSETYGVALYQEQIMTIANIVGGFSLAEADGLRKAMGKKLPEVMATYRAQFVAGATAQNISERLADEIFDMMLKFAGYGFNKSHSAAYAVIGAQTAYLKANYPVEFMAALLTTDAGNSDRVVSDVAECRRLGIPILGPDINKSELDFSVDLLDDGSEVIRFGLSAVKTVGRGAAAAIVDARNNIDTRRFESLDQFVFEVDWTRSSKRVAESLARAGAFESFGTRKAVLEALDLAIGSANQRRKAVSRGQLVFDLTAGAEQPVLTAQRLPDTGEFSMKQLLNWERELLGVYVSNHPVVEALQQTGLHGRHQIGELKDLPPGDNVRIVGQIITVRRLITKKGQPMAIAEVEDLTGSIDLVFWPEIYESYGTLLEPDTILDIQARLGWRNEKLQLIVNSVSVELERLGSSGRKLHITIPPQESDEEWNRLMQQVNRILQTSEGDDEVVIHLLLDDQDICLLSRTRRVTADERLVADLRRLLGDQALRTEDPAFQWSVLKPTG